ncbi:MAG: response regulator [Lachnospiraceae bacterium]|nr:response regulator [Lachnospiraceae bacterium]
MKKKNRTFYLLLVVSVITIICFVTFFYIRQLNITISDNTISSISELADHDKTTIETYIDICWQDLREIEERFVNYECGTIRDIETRIRLESLSGIFEHIYLMAEDGTVYTGKYAGNVRDEQAINGDLDFMPYFANGEEQVVERYVDGAEGSSSGKESILYGIRLKDFEVEGIKMLALIGISDTSVIRDNMVINSFVVNGKSRGKSALIDLKGNYIINVNKEGSANRTDNLFVHLEQSETTEMTVAEVAEKIEKEETFSFYHRHVGERYQELFYFIPFREGIDLYFVMAVNEAVFREQTNTFVTMSMLMLFFSMLTVVVMLLLVMKYQNKTIRETEKARSQKEFLSNMSHEIRTPLNGLIGMNHLIMIHIDDDGRKPQIKDWLKKSHSTANYLLSLVNDILDISKLQAGKIDIFREPLMVEALVDEIAAMQADNIESRGVEFIVEKDITAPCIEGDVTRTKQILMNIVGNAAKFTPKGKYIKFSVRQEQTDDGHVTTVYQCEDAGIGISKEYIGKIFDSFSQEKNRNTSEIKGTGLGMAISKLLADAMGGSITVESELGVGSTFTVRIPSAVVKEIPDYLKESGETKSVETHGTTETAKQVKILVAEDVEMNAEILMEILSMEGFETAHAWDGGEAVEIFKNSEIGEFDIILMDMQMPVMDGCTASKEIRKLNRPDAKTVMIYACTANTFQEDRDMAMESGMNDFLTKPIDVKILLKKMGRTTQ